MIPIIEAPLASAQRLSIVAEARAWLGTPYKHQGRIKGIGTDCAGLILGVGAALGLLDDTRTPPYGRIPHPIVMYDWLDVHCDRVSMADVVPGNILCFAFLEDPQHLAIATERGGIIHCYANVRRCAEHRLDQIWRARLRSVWAYRGVA